METRTRLQENKILRSSTNLVIDDQDPDLQNLSMESVVRNKKSYFRIVEGVRLTDPFVKELIVKGSPLN